MGFGDSLFYSDLEALEKAKRKAKRKIRGLENMLIVTQGA